MIGPFVSARGGLVPFRHVYREEWLHAWHYARYGRRHCTIPCHVGPLLREAVHAVLTQRRDVLSVRAAMARTCHPLSAVIATRREFASSLG